jgi:hypothetical protein
VEAPHSEYLLAPAFNPAAFNNAAFHIGVTHMVPASGNLVQSRPEFYCFSGADYRTLQFYGTPSEDVTSQANGLWDLNIPNCVIMEFYRLPDNLSGAVLPVYFRNEMFKNFVLSRAFAKEGPGQRPDLSKYYAAMYVENLATLKDILKANQRGQMYSYEAPLDNQEAHQAHARYPLQYGIPFYV